jgi:hypothetical protein
MQNADCLVCGTKAEVVSYNAGSGADTICPRCGSFKIGGLASHEMSHWSQQQRVNLSGWIRDHQGCEIVISDVPRLAALSTPPVGEKAEKVLLRLSTAFPKPGARLNVETRLRTELLGRASASDDEELTFLLQEYLFHEKAYLTDEGMKISPKGWAHLHALAQTNNSSQQGFIAMWFADEVNEAWKAIDRGIADAGYSPLRIDQKQHNNEITDEMIAEIRKSRFLVADLTGHRNGVYYEAGFAKGLGIGVIWLCRKDELMSSHFDVNHFAIIPWEVDKLEDLSNALKNRIEATHGRGPLMPLNPSASAASA